MRKRRRPQLVNITAGFLALFGIATDDGVVMIYRSGEVDRLYDERDGIADELVKLVAVEDTIDWCERVLNDEFSEQPESALYMIGDIGEVAR